MRSRLGLALAALIVCAGCGFTSAYNANLATLGAVVHDGFLAVRVNHTPEFPSAGKQVTVAVITSGSKAETSGISSTAGAEPVQVIAHDVWDTFPYHFDTLSVTIVGNQPSAFAAAQLEAIFGPRPTNLESANLSGTVSAGWDELYAVLGAVIALIVIDIIRVEMRRRRVHRGRLLEAATAHEHVHLGQHEIDLWSGQAAHAQYGHEAARGASTSPDHITPYRASTHPDPTNVHDAAPLPPVPHIPIPWSGHSNVAHLMASLSENVPTPAGSSPNPPHPGPPPVR